MSSFYSSLESDSSKESLGSLALEALVSLVILVLLTFRILIWWRAESTQGKFIHRQMEKKLHPNYAEKDDTVCHSLTFCNANPFRATALYSAGFYDKVSQIAHDTRFSLIDFDFSTDQLQQYSHTEPADKTLLHLELVLDPEENEYVLPNDGFIGFYILLNRSSADQGDFFIGTGFHNIVRLSLVVPNNVPSCSSAGGSQLRVDSITQTVKSALYQSLLPRGLMNSVVDTDRT
ncbi:hypothetical protein ACTXT7_002702 [Hymenolepis weldensis]